MRDCTIVPVSALQNIGIDTLRGELLALQRSLPPRAVEGNFRLAVDRSFLQRRRTRRHRHGVQR
ncbi:MAG: hypothetical protein IPG43_24565 [Proteobacteria bacterium]|nr:hypothetical protein [Pseudomonadota bacterium]